MKIAITYMSGAGNLFSVIDGRLHEYSRDEYFKLAPLLCSKHDRNKYETEGILVINPSDNYDFTVDFYNPDGSYGAMCGNGSRCAVYFAIVNGFFKKENDQDIYFRMADRDYKARVSGGLISVYFPTPAKVIPDILINANDITVKGSYVNVGADHFVINYYSLNQFTGIDFSRIDINEFAKPIRLHPEFAPAGVNINIYKPENDNTILLRTYERGVEAETGACGTGSISTAIISAMKNEVEFPVCVIPTSQEALYIDVEGVFPHDIKSVILTGSAVIIGSNEIQTVKI